MQGENFQNMTEKYEFGRTTLENIEKQEEYDRTKEMQFQHGKRDNGLMDKF